MGKILVLLALTILINAEDNVTKLVKKEENTFSYTKSIKKHNQTKSDSELTELKQNGTTFYIQKLQLKKYDEMIKMILATESMDDDERQYWFDIIPSMTDKQIDKLYNILEVERAKLQQLETKYQKEIKTLNEKHLIEWQEFQMKKRQEAELNGTSEKHYKNMLEEIKKIRQGE